MNVSAGMQLSNRRKQPPRYRKSSSSAEKTKWVIYPSSPNAKQLAKSLSVTPLTAQLLINRGITDTSTALDFLRPKLSNLISPDKMPGIEKAVPRLAKAIKNKEKITIYGDYDVDGITGVAILWQILTLIGANVDFYIPHRIDEGYGLNTEAVRSIAKQGTKLLVTIDCGISACESADEAKKIGIDLIVTDHHQAGPALPQAVAIVHPALNETYENKDSAGAMVAFKLAWAVANQFRNKARLEGDVRDFMINAVSLAAMGTIADVVDLRGENRILASFGLKALPQSSLCGIKSLIETAGLTGQGLDSFHIGFRLAPMLNAAGRMGHARLAVELLTTASPDRAAHIAEYLKSQNTLRQQCERAIFKQACEMIHQAKLDSLDQKTIVLACCDWHTGVIGIVASRIVETFHKPAILINTGPESDTPSQGSARSIDGFHILDAITACKKYLVKFGGHKMAAGITIKNENIHLFSQDIENYAKETMGTENTDTPLRIDTASKLGDFSHNLVRELELLAPFGQGNPQPLFATNGVRLAAPPRRVGSNGDHLQLAITDSTAHIRCVGFGLGNLEKKLTECDCFNIAYQPHINNYNGQANVELILADIKW